MGARLLAIRPTISPPIRKPVGDDAGGGGLPSRSAILGLWLDGEDIIGLSISDKLLVRAEIWALLFDGSDIAYSNAQRIINIEASVITNDGGELMWNPLIGGALYPNGTTESVLRRAYRYFNITYPEVPMSITQHGITWTFANPVEYGQFVNGDYWVVDPGSGVAITDISPGYTTDPRAMNGSMINPTEAVNQGYDGDRDYVSALNVGIGVSASTPLVLQGNKSLVSTISNIAGTVGDASYVNTAAILTCLSTAPAPGSFRPGVSSTAKVLHNIGTLDYGLLASLADYPVAKPDIAVYTAYLQLPWLTHNTGWTGRYIHPSASGMSNYYYATVFAKIALMLHLDYTLEEKTPLLINYIQLGIDAYSYLENTYGWPPDGGHQNGRKWPIMFAGLMLGYAPMRDIGQKSGDYLYVNGVAADHPADFKFFGEDGQTFYVAQSDVDVTNGGTWDPNTTTAPNYPYTVDMIGMPEWGLRYSTAPNRSDAGWLAAYRNISTAVPAWAGFALASYIMGVKSLWNHDVFFDYIDRYSAISLGGPDPFGYVAPAEAAGSNIGEPMWASHRPNYPMPPYSTVVSAIIMGQSEPRSLFDTGSFYRVLPAPTPANGNLVIETCLNSVSEEIIVSPATLASNDVSNAMAALSEFLDYTRPGYTFYLGDGTYSGSSRYELTDDSVGRLWGDMAILVSNIETATGAPVTALVECWYNSDASSINTFKNSFWPLYFGTNANGTEFTLGSTNPLAVNLTAVFDHCLYDGIAGPAVKGRGILARSETTWEMLTPMPFLDGPVAPTAELVYFSNSRLNEPSRENIDGLATDTLAQSVSLRIGPSTHVCQFGGLDTQIHPNPGSFDGQMMFMWPFAFSLLRLSGVTVIEPDITTAECPVDGSYVDVLVPLPNGGTLTTLQNVLSYADPTVEPPHYQDVVGFEIIRGGTRHPVYKETETGYDVNFRGTVIILNTGSGTPRRGVVRITPTVPFVYGNAVSYLRGAATAVLLEDRDTIGAQLYRNMLLEHIPSLYDASALYPCPGIAVKPYQSNLAVPMEEPAFSPQSTAFDGTTSKIYSINSSMVGTNQGIFCCFFKPMDSVTRYILELRTGAGTIVFQAYANGGKFHFRLYDLPILSTSVGSAPTGQWNSLMLGYKNGEADGLQVYLNGVDTGLSRDMTLTNLTVDQALPNIRAMALSSTFYFLGDVGYFYLNMTDWLNFDVQANRDKFLLSKSPVYLGANGELPTGNIPQVYLDGGAAMQNFGSGGAFTGISLAAGSVPLLP